jgi:hypothetical protein
LEQAVADGSQPGLLWLPATQAPQVLAGGGVFLERLATIWLEGEVANDGLDPELVDRLEASCHRLERDDPNHQLWRLDWQRLLEREILRVTQLSNSLQERVEELEGQLAAQAEQTAEQSQQREMFQARVEELEAQLSALIAQMTEQRPTTGDSASVVCQEGSLALSLTNQRNTKVDTNCAIIINTDGMSSIICLPGASSSCTG